MIDRKAFWISGTLVVAMLAAALWRVTQLADWTQLPRHGASSAPLWHTSSAWLLVAPGAIVVAGIALLTMRMGMVDASDEALRPWKKWGGSYLIAYSAIMASLQAFIIAGTLGLLGPISPVLFFRGIIVVFGLLLIVTSNGLPKLPWLPSRFALVDIDPDKGAKSLRFRGWLGVLSGLGALVTGLLPLGMMRPAILSIVVSWVVGGLFFRFATKRNQIQ
jgi:hypothetical protein